MLDSIDFEEEVEEEIWNVNEDFVEVLSFIVVIGLIFGVVEDGIAIEFFYLMFFEEFIEYIVVETNRYA